MTSRASGGPPDEFLEYRLVRLASRLERRFAATLAPTGLSPRQFSVLAVLTESPGVTSAELARAVLTTPQSMGALLDQMESRGLVERTAERGRGRAAPIRVTDAGAALLREAYQLVDALDGATRQRLGERDHQQLTRLLAVLEGHVGED
ncbi:MarR family winged helix-turn-helix transcriptional regulator [Micromonospora maritima]|uniref:MarR family winged helix-turn-helix transcriptional regulator n=1 Tax=Micromonospora maritima TaxID=986711 RepID=UPI00157C99BB|nr:MarR family transcriptional regulator [Micromonospora maritima]